MTFLGYFAEAMKTFDTSLIVDDMTYDHRMSVSDGTNTVM